MNTKIFINMQHLAFLLLLVLTSLHARAESVSPDTIVSGTQAIIDSKYSMDSDQAPSEFDTSANPPVFDFDYTQTHQWQDYKRLRKLGWTFFGVGVPLVGVSFGLVVAAFLTTDEAAKILGPIAGITFLAGGSLTLASIPILTVAYVKRYKAKHMQVDLAMSALQAPAYGLSASLSSRFSPPALGLSISF